MIKFEVLDTTKHNRANFICEEEVLTIYLKERANKEQTNNMCVCHVTLDNDANIIGYYTLSNDRISKEEAPQLLQKKINYPSVGVILIGRMARHISEKGTELGRLLLADALQKCLTHSEIIGAMMVVVDPKNEIAENFYAKYGFAKLPNSKRMFLPTKSIHNPN